MSAPHQTHPAPRIIFLSVALLAWGLFGGEANAEGRPEESPRIFQRYLERLLRTTRGFFGQTATPTPPDAGVIPAYLEFIPASGIGVPQISHHVTALCDALAAEVPSWSTPVGGGAGNWCLGGDGAAVAGSERTFVAVGTPTTIDAPVCPSGLDCLAATGQPIRSLQLAGSQALTTSVSLAASTGPMTTCFWGRGSNVVSADRVLLGHGTGTTAGTTSWGIERTLTGSLITFYVSNGTTRVGATVTDQGQTTLSLLCFSHAGGDAVVKPYLDGALSTPSASTTRQSVTAKPTIHGTNGTGVATYADHVLGAFYVDQQLSDAAILAISQRVLASAPEAIVNGTVRFPMTYARTGGARFCARSDNLGTIIPSTRACIADNSYFQEPLAINRTTQSQTFDGSNWTITDTLSRAITRTGDYDIAPDGSKTADRVQFNSTTGIQESVLRQAVSVTNGVMSVYVKGNGMSGVIDLAPSVAGATSGCGCAFNATTWTRCVTTVPVNTSSMRIGNAGTTAACDTGTRAAIDVLLWGAQTETSQVTSYVPVPNSGTTTRGFDSMYVTHGQAEFNTGCIATNYETAPYWAQSDAGILTLADVAAPKQAIAAINSSVTGFVGGVSTASTATPMLGEHRYAFSWQPSGSSLSFDGTSTAGVAGTPATTDRLYIGGADGGSQAGWYSQLQYDSDPARCSIAGPTTPYFAFAPDSGAGLPSWPTFCSSPSLSGGWCANADATTTGDTLTLGGDAVVTPTTLCPNGPDCSSVNALKFTTTGFAGTTAYTLSTAFTACWHGIVGSGQTDYNIMLAHALSGSTTEMTFSVEWAGATDTYDFYVRNSTCSSATWKPGVPQLVCAVHAGGTAFPALYVDGTLACTGNLSVDAPDVSTPDTIGGRNGVESFGDDMTTLGAFVARADIRAALPAIYAAIVPTLPKAIINGSTQVPMAYSRTGSRFCSKADNTGSILPASRACIAQGGYLSEASATNLVLRSQEFDNAAWVPYGVGATPAAITANYAVAPDSTKTSERLYAYATTSGQVSGAYQNLTVSAGSNTFSVFVRGVSGSGTLDVCSYTSGSVYQCSNCAYTNTATTRCSVSVTTSTVGSVLIGNGTAYTGTVRAVNDALVWGAQVETGSVATSYVPTTSASAVRGNDVGTFTVPGGPAANLFSAAVTAVQSTDNRVQYPLPLKFGSLPSDTSGRGVWFYSNSFGAGYNCLAGNDAAGFTFAGSSVLEPAAPWRMWCAQDGTGLQGSVGGTAMSGGSAPVVGTYSPTTSVQLGNNFGAPTTSAFGGILSDVCIDPVPLRCR